MTDGERRFVKTNGEKLFHYFFLDNFYDVSGGADIFLRGVVGNYGREKYPCLLWKCVIIEICQKNSKKLDKK
jgi:hypothetical protein